MARSKTMKLRVKAGKGRIPEAIQYGSLKSMSRTDSVKDKNQRERKAAKLAIRKGEY